MPQTATELAAAGYTEAMKLIAAGNLSSVTLWRPEAFDRYREAVIGGGPSSQWLHRFNIDLWEELDHSFTADYIGPGHEHYPINSSLLADDFPAVVVVVTRIVGESNRTLTFIIRPDLEQALHAIKRMRFI